MKASVTSTKANIINVTAFLTLILLILLMTSWSLFRPVTGGPLDGQGAVNAQFGFWEELVGITSLGEFDRVRYRGAEQDMSPEHIGFPELPVFTFRFVLPPETRVDSLDVTVTEADTLSGTYVPIPVQPVEGDFVRPDSSVYESEAPYPRKPVQLSVDGFMRGFHLLTVAVYPVQYVGALGKLVVPTRVRVSVLMRPLTAEETATVSRRYRPDSRPPALRPEEQWIRRHVLNPDDLDRFRPQNPQLATPDTVESPFGGFVPTEFPSLEGPPVLEVMITNDSRDGVKITGMTDVFEDWTDWKTLKGVPAVVKTVDWIEENYTGVDRPEKMRNFIKDAYAYWGTDFVLLGGDLDIVPTRLIGGPWTPLIGAAQRVDPPSDMYFGELDASWNEDQDAYIGESTLDITGQPFGREYLDLWVGRIPASDSLQAAVILEKISSYVRRPGHTSETPASSYYSKILLAAGPTNGVCDGPSNGIFVAATIMDSLRNSSFSVDTTRMYPEYPDSTRYCSSVGSDVQCFKTLIETMRGGPDEDLLVQNVEEALNEGHAYVFHYEHSMRSFLGLLSRGAIEQKADLCDCAGSDNPWHDSCRVALENFLQGKNWDDDLTREVVDDLTNGPEYSVVVSGGSFSNQFDLDPVGEHFLRNPDGGAVAYIGKTAGFGVLADVPLNFFVDAFNGDIVQVGMALGLATNDFGANVLAACNTWRLLGDPEMPLWTEAPGTLSVSTTPSTLSKLGAQTITVEVEDTAENPVEGARVCLKQLDLAYAVSWTDSDGEATFPAYHPLSTDSICVLATARNYRPSKKYLKFGSQAGSDYVAYQRHIRDDDVDGGDGDGVLEAGETVHLRVLTKNLGTGAVEADGIVAHLWPTAPIIFDLDIDGAYEPQEIYIGDQEAHPADSTFRALADTFRLPMNWEAIRPEGEPDVTSGNTHFSVWRDTTSFWHVRADYAFDSSLLEGLLTTQGGFDSVSWTYESGVDTVYYDEDEPDTIRFEFHRDGSADEVKFRASAYNWVDVLTDEVRLGSMAGGDTASGVFEVSWTGKVPDNDQAVFTLAVRDTNRSWWYSDFSEIVHAPRVRHLVQKVESGATSPTCPVSRYVYPTLVNLGSASADTSVVILQETSGDIDVKVSVVELGAIAPGDTLKADDEFVLCAASESLYDDFRYSLEIRTYHPNGDSTIWGPRDNADVVGPEEPDSLVVDEHAGAVVLRWAETGSDDVEGYHVFRCLADDTTRLTREPVLGTLRYEVTGLEPFDSGEYIDYLFAISAVDSSGNESGKVFSDTARVLLPEAAGWPQRMRSGHACAPKVFDLNEDGDLEIIVGGQEIYAWKANGDPLLSSSEDGLFYDPDPDGVGTEHAVFVEALAIADIDDDGRYEIVGNMPPDSLIVVEYNAASGGSVSREWARALGFTVTARSAPILEDLDEPGDGKMEIILADDKDWIRVWTYDGKTYGKPAETDGKFAQNRFGTYYNYKSLSVGDAASESGKEIFQTLSQGNVVVCYSSSAAETLWTAQVSESAAHLSLPVVGDVDGDDDLELAFTRMTAGDEGVVHVVEAETGDEETYLASDDFFFEVPEGSGLLAPLAMADLDGDDDLDIVAGGGEPGAGGLEDPWAWTIELHVLMEESGDLSDTTLTDDIPVPGRKLEDVITDNQPVVADIDGNNSLEVVVPVGDGYLACFEWMPESEEGKAEPGWPQLFHDTPNPPTIADLDGEGNLEMVVTDAAGWVYVFELPGSASGAELPWPEYGHDPRNTFNASTTRWGRTAPPGDGTTEALDEDDLRLKLGPNPFNPYVRLFFGLKSRSRIRAEIIDVNGRRVRGLVDEPMAAGKHQIIWNGVTDSGHRVSSGVYFLRFGSPDGIEVHKILVVK